LFILEVVNKRTRMEECAPLLASVCRKWRPNICATEAKMEVAKALSNDCRRFPEIPELRLLPHGNKPKLDRATTAINMGANGRIYLPDAQVCLEMKERPGVIHTWVDETMEQLKSFTGMVNQGHDDIVDVFGYTCLLAHELRGVTARTMRPVMLTAGRESVFMG
jgi:hypothetical protein